MKTNLFTQQIISHSLVFYWQMVREMIGRNIPVSHQLILVLERCYCMPFLLILVRSRLVSKLSGALFPRQDYLAMLKIWLPRSDCFFSPAAVTHFLVDSQENLALDQDNKL